MSTFTAWNLRLLQHFFPRASAGTEVWLATTPEELDIVGHDLGGDAGLIECVRDGPRWPTVRQEGNRFGRGEPHNFFDRCNALASQRRTPPFRPPNYVDPGILDPDYEGMDAPTYLPFLAALVRTAARMDGGGFYAQLAADLGVGGVIWGSIQMGVTVDSVWGDLENWTFDHSHHVGKFRCRPIGGFTLIGVPKAQVILTRQDHERLPRLFTRMGWLPDGGVGSAELHQLESQSARNKFAFMSTGFREACQKATSAFADPLQTLLGAVLDEWDGIDSGARESGGSRSQTRDAAVALLLRQPVDQMPDWTLAPMLSREDLVEGDGLKWGDVVWSLFEGSSDCRVGVGTAANGAALLEASVASSVSLSLTGTRGLDGDLSGEETFELPPSTARYFVRDTWSPCPEGYQALLVERSVLPTSAPFLVLSRVSQGVNTVRMVLASHGVSYAELPTTGLPTGWSLLRVDDASTLGQARQELPGPWDGRNHAPRRIRLVGGIRVLRGGSWYYLGHSLPSLEVDASSAFALVASGVTLTDARQGDGVLSLEAQGVVGDNTELRRYVIELSPDGTRQSRIVLADAEGNAVETVTLRVLGDDVTAVVREGGFRMNSLGAPAREGERGIIGPRVDSESEIQLRSISFTLPSMGRSARAEELEGSAQSVAGRFLDLVSHKGHMTTGRARDDIRTLAAARSAPIAVRPDDLLRGLWIAGHVELEVDAKGRWTRVHAVPPTLYSIPLVTTSGAQVACVAGSLSHTHWNRLTTGASAVSSAFVSNNPELEIPVVRVSADDSGTLREYAARVGLIFVEHAAERAAEWAGDLAQVQVQWGEGGRETAPRGFLDGAEYFWAHKGHFGSVRMQFPTGVELLRGIDPETGSSRLHMMELDGEDGAKRFSFVRDQWWARWHALGALTQFLAAGERSGAWPIHYSSQTGSVWLPGRLSLPVALARTLVLCSGSLPVVHRVVRGVRQDRLEVMNRIGTHLLTASTVYEGMLPPAPRESVWLEYRWVPEPVAMEVARKIGAAVVPA